MNSIHNFQKISNRIYCGGQPERDQFVLLEDYGIRTVINLALPTSKKAIPEEGFIVADLGMTHIQIPVIFEHPTVRDLHRFYRAMEVALDEPVFVHCALNYRASCFVYLYRVTIGREVPEIARKDMEKIWSPIPAWNQFLEENSPPV